MILLWVVGGGGGVKGWGKVHSQPIEPRMYTLHEGLKLTGSWGYHTKGCWGKGTSKFNVILMYMEGNFEQNLEFSIFHLYFIVYAVYMY